MRKHLTLRDAHPGLDPRHRFGGAWAAAFLGVVANHRGGPLGDDHAAVAPESPLVNCA